MELSAQLGGFLSALGIGALLGVLFDCYRVMRGTFRPKAWMTALMDGIYWLVAIAAAFACLFLSNWAEIRLHLFWGICIGAAVYYKLASGIILFCLLKLLHSFAAAWKAARRITALCVVRPLGYFFGVFSYPFRYGAKRARSFKRRAKKIFAADSKKDSEK